MAFPSNFILVWVWFVLGCFLFSPFLSFTPCLNSPFGDSDCVWRARIRMPYFCMSLPLGNSLILLNLRIGPLVVPTTFSDIGASVSSWLQSVLGFCGFLVWFSRLLWLFGLCTPQTGLNTWCDIRLKVTRAYYVHENKHCKSIQYQESIVAWDCRDRKPWNREGFLQYPCKCERSYLSVQQCCKYQPCQNAGSTSQLYPCILVCSQITLGSVWVWQEILPSRRRGCPTLLLAPSGNSTMELWSISVARQIASEKWQPLATRAFLGRKPAGICRIRVSSETRVSTVSTSLTKQGLHSFKANLLEESLVVTINLHCIVENYS